MTQMGVKKQGRTFISESLFHLFCKTNSLVQLSKVTAYLTEFNEPCHQVSINI